MSSVNDSTTPRSQLRVGRLTKAHGLKGAIKLELFTDDPGRRFVPGAVFTLQVPTGSPWHGKKIELVELRWYNQHAVGFFKDVPDREAAEALAKAILWIDQDDAEPSGEEDAWYDHQLIGLAVVRDGVKIGTIARLEHLPAQDLLIVKTPAGEAMIPFVKAIVPSVDITTGIVTITPPPGLLEELPDEADDEADDSADDMADEEADDSADDMADEEADEEDDDSADDSAGVITDESVEGDDDTAATAAPETESEPQAEIDGAPGQS